MVVPTCLRSPATNSSISLLRLTAASCRTITSNVATSTNMKSNLIRNTSSGFGSFLKIDKSAPSLNSIKSFNYSTVTTALRTEDEAIVDVLNGETFSKPASGNVASASAQYAEASDRAWSAFQTLKSEKTLNASDYVNALRQLSEARDFNRCKVVFNEIKAAGIELDSEMFSLILNSGRRTLRSNEIREFFGDNSEYIQRKSEAAASDESHHSRSQFFDQISALVQEMISKNLRPTVWFYDELANFLTAINQAGVLINLATAMEKRGEQPSTKFYNRMLHCLPRCGLLDRATMLFNRMVLRGNADYYTYLVRASSLVYVNEMEGARTVLSEMKGKHQMDTVAYNILIKSYLAQGNCEQAVKVFKQMTRESSIAPNRITCRTFLSYFYESANLTHSEPIVSYFERANFPETFEDYGNVIKFFARYDPPKVTEIFNQLKSKITSESSSNDKNQVYHSFLRVLNDRQVTNDWKKSFANLILEGANPEGSSLKATTLNAPELPYYFRAIIDRIESPDSVTYEIVLKKLIQLRRFDSVKALYQSMFNPENSHYISAQPVHRNLNLTALLMSRDLEAAREFINEMHGRRIPISGKNTTLLEEAGIELPRGALTAKKGQGVTANRSNRQKSENRQQQQNNLHHNIMI
jgi:pentatricopeptide repeat protein